MDHLMLRQHLAQAKQHVATGESHVRRQRDLIAELEHNGHDTAAAKELLVQFERLQALHIADRDRLEQKLAPDT